MDDDVILCLLEDTLTKPERQLKASGRDVRLLELGATLQETMEEALTTGMESLLGRRVNAVISGRQLDPDVASEVFILGERIPDAQADLVPQQFLPAEAVEKGNGGKLETQPDPRLAT